MIEKKDYFVNLPTSKLYIGNEEITENRITDVEDDIIDATSYYREYPDIFIDEVLKEEGNPFELYLIQRVMLRIFARYRYVFSTFNRGYILFS